MLKHLRSPLRAGFVAFGRRGAKRGHAIGTKMQVRTKAKLPAAPDEPMPFIAANRDRVRNDFQGLILKGAA